VRAQPHSSQPAEPTSSGAPATPGGNTPGWSSSRSTIFKGSKFSFEAVTLTGPGGRTLERQVVRHPGAVVILPILEEPGRQTRIVLIRNVRVALERELLELPAGTLEAGESPAHCAMRELSEETGYEAATLDPIGRFHTTPGLTDELMYAYAARGLSHVGQHLEADESITVCPLGVQEVLTLIDRGDLVDGKSVLSIFWAIRRGLLRP
jgi:ADP-ribose pyrophosphatase